MSGGRGRGKHTQKSVLELGMKRGIESGEMEIMGEQRHRSRKSRGMFKEERCLV